MELRIKVADAIQLSSAKGKKRSAEIRWHSGCDSTSNLQQVQNLPLSDSVRLGTAMLQVVEEVFPGKHGNLDTQAAPDSPVLLVAFERLTESDWCYA